MTKPDKPPGRPGGRPPGGGAGGGNKPTPTPTPTPRPMPKPAPPVFRDPIYVDGPPVFEPDVKTGIIADQYAKLLDVPYRQAFMPNETSADSIFAAENVMPVETAADPRPYSRTKQIPIRDLYTMAMRDATDAELLGVETGPDKPLMSKDKYKMMSYSLGPRKRFVSGPPIGPPPGGITPRPGGPLPPQPINIMPPYPGPITVPRPGGTPTPGFPGGTPPPNILPIIGGTPPLPQPINIMPPFRGDPTPFTLEDLQAQYEVDSEGNLLSPVYAEGGRVGKMNGGMMIIEDGVANDGIGSILNKYKEIRSKL